MTPPEQSSACRSTNYRFMAKSRRGVKIAELSCIPVQLVFRGVHRRTESALSGGRQAVWHGKSSIAPSRHRCFDALSEESGGDGPEPVLLYRAIFLRRDRHRSALLR